jgi:hypothetical protein
VSLQGSGVDVDGAGNACVVGWEFPSAGGSGVDGVAKLNPGGQTRFPGGYWAEAMLISVMASR